MASAYAVTVFKNGSPVGGGRDVYLDGVPALTDPNGYVVFSSTAGDHAISIVPATGETGAGWTWAEDPTGDTGSGSGYYASPVPSTDGWSTGVIFSIVTGSSSPPPPPVPPVSPPPTPPPYPTTDCCDSLWWCVDGVVVQSAQKPEGATGGPWRTEAEATDNCVPPSPPPPPPPPITTSCCPDLPLTLYLTNISTGDPDIPLVWDAILGYWFGSGTVGTCDVEVKFELGCGLYYRCAGSGGLWVAATCPSDESGGCFNCGPPFTSTPYTFLNASLSGCGCAGNFTGNISD